MFRPVRRLISLPRPRALGNTPGNAPLGRRNFISLPQGEALFLTTSIIGANGAVYLLWQTADTHFMHEHFTVSRAGIISNPHTLLTSMFSHNRGGHLLGNMVTLFFFAPPVVEVIGGSAFLSLYLGSGIFASFCHIASSRHPRQPALGASGALNAVVAFSILHSPWQLIVAMAEFIPVPMPAILSAFLLPPHASGVSRFNACAACRYGSLYIGRDVAALLDIDIPFMSSSLNIGHAAHVGGAFGK